VAAVEAALVTPILVVLSLGAVDAGQFANCYQKVSDASREGARVAARFRTNDVATVEAVVRTYLQEMFPGVPEATLTAATQITVRDSSGNVITGATLGSLGTGAQVELEVSMQFDLVRWMNAIPVLGGRTVTTTTMMRRE
jgi:Flp pilus assembly protein TadG